MVKGVATTVAVFAVTVLLVNRFVTVSPAAGAQEVAPAPVPVMAQGAPFPRSPGGAGAFGAEGGIVEQGRATVSVPADRLRLTFRAYGGQGVPVADAGKTVVDAMHANGIPDAQLREPVLGNLQNNEQIEGTIASPTREKVAAIEQRILAALPQPIISSLRNVNVGGALEADDCTAALAHARALAFADARGRAQALAEIAGVRLGGLVSASETDQTIGCANFGATPFINNGFNGNDTLAKTAVDVTASMTATFAILPKVPG